MAHEIPAYVNIGMSITGKLLSHRDEPLRPLLMGRSVRAKLVHIFVVTAEPWKWSPNRIVPAFYPRQADLTSADMSKGKMEINIKAADALPYSYAGVVAPPTCSEEHSWKKRAVEMFFPCYYYIKAWLWPCPQSFRQRSMLSWLPSSGWKDLGETAGWRWNHASIFFFIWRISFLTTLSFTSSLLSCPHLRNDTAEL